jgi:predicted transcriptional regulator
MADSIRMQIRLPKDVRAWLENLANQNDRSMNWQLVSVLRMQMDMQKTVAQSDQK